MTGWYRVTAASLDMPIQPSPSPPYGLTEAPSPHVLPACYETQCSAQHLRAMLGAESRSLRGAAGGEFQKIWCPQLYYRELSDLCILPLTSPENLPHSELAQNLSNLLKGHFKPNSH